MQKPHLKKKKQKTLKLQFCHIYTRLTLEKLHNSAFLHNRLLSLHNVTAGKICIIISDPNIFVPYDKVCLDGSQETTEK